MIPWSAPRIHLRILGRPRNFTKVKMRRQGLCDISFESYVDTDSKNTWDKRRRSCGGALEHFVTFSENGESRSIPLPRASKVTMILFSGLLSCEFQNKV